VVEGEVAEAQVCDNSCYSYVYIQVKNLIETKQILQIIMGCRFSWIAGAASTFWA
jgi:hypothetical protein